MSKGGGSTTTSTSQAEIPDWVQDAAKANLSRADYVSRLGYVPQYGIDVAGFTPMQSSAMQNTANAAAAFGLQAPVDAMAGMPQTQTNNLGFTGYSSGDIYDTYQANLKRRSPDQYNLVQGMFGATPDIVFTPAGSITTNAAPVAVRNAADYNLGGNANSRSSGTGYDWGQMGSGMENFLLGLATADYPVFYGLGNMVGRNAIDNRMEAIQDQIDRTYDLSQRGILTAIDSSGNVSSTYSPSTFGGSSSGAPAWDSTGNVWNGGGWSSADDARTTSYTPSASSYSNYDSGSTGSSSYSAGSGSGWSAGSSADYGY